MKPRFTPRDEKFDSLLKEAQQLEERLEKASPPNTESTIASHEGGSDERPAALKKMGTSGEQWRLDTITKSIHNLSRRLE